MSEPSEINWFDRKHRVQTELLRVLREAGVKPAVLANNDRVYQWASRLTQIAYDDQEGSS